MIKSTSEEEGRKNTFAKLITSNSRFISFQVRGLLPFKKEASVPSADQTKTFLFAIRFRSGSDLQGAISNKQTLDHSPHLPFNAGIFPPTKAILGPPFFMLGKRTSTFFLVGEVICLWENSFICSSNTHPAH
ncbi:hypothetical protein CEXT_324751 [Caerostris extrusa]|uniref:Uncharacterized protein n=1 Tax=Caerostris extrusa TaxID=172846 RepID=A0AAV4WHP4_CAEEX|nr:hypothetical protein CEXT_324751 [Caerostris extrusa]